jgi:hypothetical protein
MPSRRTRSLATTGLVAATALALAAPPVGAAEEGRERDGRTLERCTSAIDRRLATLAQLGDRARASGPLTDAHEAAIVATTTEQARSLSGLRAEVVAAPTAAARAEGCRRVVPEYRVYLLTRPKVHLTLAADVLTAATGRLDEALTALEQAADTADAGGRDTSAARAEIAAARAGSATARTSAGGVPGAVLPLEPAGYPANAPVLTASRATLTGARTTLRAAAQDARDARRLLQP